MNDNDDEDIIIDFRQGEIEEVEENKNEVTYMVIFIFLLAIIGITRTKTFLIPLFLQTN